MRADELGGRQHPQPLGHEDALGSSWVREQAIVESTGFAMRVPARMINPLQHYAWGSRTTISCLQGRKPTDRPEAEFWMGAHPAAPWHVEVGEKQLSLLEVIERSPHESLGPAVQARFGARLPYLLKVLAAAKPLSLQAHPTEAQALHGFHAEKARRVPIDAPERNYRDASAKLELLCALSPVDALCGFRDITITIEWLERLRANRLQPLIDVLRSDPPEVAMPAVLERVLTWPLHDRSALVAEVCTAAKQLSDDKRGFAAEASSILRLAELHPGDPGVVAALLLNLIRLEPGEALYMPFGNLHAYLGGCGVEIMANSYNVLRGGLTPKHVDVLELQRGLDHSAGPIAVVTPKQVSDHEAVYDTTATDFRLSRIGVRAGAAVAVNDHGPQILLCLEGHVTLDADGSTLALTKGQSAFIPAATATVRCNGAGVFLSRESFRDDMMSRLRARK